MLALVAILILVVIIGSQWWFGTWNCLINLVNFFIAALVASSFYEVVAAKLVEQMPSFVYLAEFISIWLLFFLTFGLLRAATDLLSRYRMKLDPWVDYVGRGVLSLWLALAFLSFTFFTFHLAPFPPDAFQADPGQRVLGIGPDRFWMAFIQSRSRGALRESKSVGYLPAYNQPLHPDDEGLDARVFDSRAQFILRNQERRRQLSNQEFLRTSQ